VELALFFCALWVLHHVWLHIILKFFVPLYNQQVGRDIADYRMNWNSFIHASISAALSVYCSFYACGDGKTFFNDKECREEPRNIHVWTLMFTASYLFVDSIVLIVWTDIKTPIERQTMMHHVFGFQTMYMAFWK
jgi:hypothetical protein